MPKRYAESPLFSKKLHSTLFFYQQAGEDVLFHPRPYRKSARPIGRLPKQERFLMSFYVCRSIRSLSLLFKFVCKGTTNSSNSLRFSRKNEEIGFPPFISPHYYLLQAVRRGALFSCIQRNLCHKGRYLENLLYLCTIKTMSR